MHVLLLLLLLRWRMSTLSFAAATSGRELLLQQELDLLVPLLVFVLQAQDLGFEELVLLLMFSQVHFQPNIVHLQGFNVDDAVGIGPRGFV